MAETLKEFQNRLARIGDVNLAAINEYEQLKTRHDFLIEQRDDLIKALEDLQKVIRKINRITQERFITTFNRINEKLAEVFLQVGTYAGMPALNEALAAYREVLEERGEWPIE